MSASRSVSFPKRFTISGQLGDFIFLEGMNFPRLGNGWIVVPATALDQGRQLLSCGIFFVVGESQEFMIATMQELSDGKFEVLCTDEAAGAIAAVQALNARADARRLGHRLCLPQAAER